MLISNIVFYMFGCKNPKIQAAKLHFVFNEYLFISNSSLFFALNFRIFPSHLI